VGFGIPDYDSFVHAPKIQNAIARIKELLPQSVSLRTKGGLIYWDGPKDAVIRIVPLPHEVRLIEDLSEVRFVTDTQITKTFERPMHPRVLAERAGKNELSRDELQDLMRLSKATMVRLIEQWLSQGLLRKQGAGRGTTYLIETVKDSRLTQFA
jgi:hypothetical protein